jgi:hypothetical protein
MSNKNIIITKASCIQNKFAEQKLSKPLSNMEALKHNFLLRGYFRRLEKQKQKEEAKSSVKID